jgi:glycosyltransferase involved in cell wall biosynthesis
VRIAVEAWAAAEVAAGRGRYVRELLRALAALDTGHEWLLLTREPWEELPGMRWVRIPWKGPVWQARAAAAARGADLLWATTSYALTGLSPVPAAATVYDFVAFHRELGAPRGAALERLTLPIAARRARRLLCISEATRDELVTRHPRTLAKAVVTPLAAGPDFTKAVKPASRDRPYVLSAATLEPRKNLPRLIEAFAQLDTDAELVLVGARGWRTEETDATIARHGARVAELGFVADEELAALYAGATAVAYPSLAEGFGLPVLEAMAAGAPVLTSDRSSMPEVAGDAAVLVDPTDVSAIRGGLARLLGDEALRATLSLRGRERAAQFTWERTARLTVEALCG